MQADALRREPSWEISGLCIGKFVFHAPSKLKTTWHLNKFLPLIRDHFGTRTPQNGKPFFPPNLEPWWYPKPPKIVPGSCLGRSWGFLGEFREAPGGVLGAIWAFWEDFERLWKRLGAVLGLSWGLPGRLWEASGAFGTVLGTVSGPRSGL